MNALIYEGRVVGFAHPSYPCPTGYSMLPLADGVTESDLPNLAVDGDVVRVDMEARLAQEKTAKVAQIKAEAAALIESLDWKLERAQEREQAGWATLADVDAVIAERENIRQSSNAAEAVLYGLSELEDVQSFVWKVQEIVESPCRLTHKEFTDRFTDEELQAVLEAAKTSQALAAWWEKFRLAQWIDLKNPATVGGVQALEIAGLIEVGRAEEVLSL